MFSREVHMFPDQNDSSGLIINSIEDINEREKPSVRLTVPVRPSQEEMLTRISRIISQSRDKDHRSQRITKATIIRAYIDALASIPFDMENIGDERTLLERIHESLQD